MSFLQNALLSDEYQSLDNPLVGTGWKQKMSPDYETEPPPVTLGDDGNYYANDNRWDQMAGEWVTIVGSEPVYYVEGGVERDKVDEDHFEIDQYGNVVTKDADFAGNGKALNPSGQWLTETQIRDRWDSDFGMSNFRKVNPDMSVDDYLGLMKDLTGLKAQGIERMGEGGLSPEYQALYDQYGVVTQYVDSDGNQYDFNGGTFTKTVDGIDKGSMVLHGLALGVLGVGASAGLASALTPALGAAGAKSASSAIINLATQSLANGGKIDLTDALISAAYAYGGAKLGEIVGSSDAVKDAVGVAEELQNKFIERGLDYTTGKGKELYDKLLRQYELMSQAGDFAKKVGGPISEIANSVWNSVNDDRSDDVDYGGANSDITGSGPDFNDDFGVDVEIEPPRFPNPNKNGGGSKGSGGNTPVQGDPDWRYEGGVWTNGTDIVVGPRNRTGVMTDEEMAEVWGTGDYTWGGDLGGGGSTDAGNTENTNTQPIPPNPFPNPNPGGISTGVGLPEILGGLAGIGSGNGKGDGEGDGEGDGDGNGEGEGEGGNQRGWKPFEPKPAEIPVFDPWQSAVRKARRQQIYKGLFTDLAQKFNRYGV